MDVTSAAGPLTAQRQGPGRADPNWREVVGVVLLVFFLAAGQPRKRLCNARHSE
jgi:hypothetical protein